MSKKVRTHFDFRARRLFNLEVRKEYSKTGIFLFQRKYVIGCLKETGKLRSEP